MGVDPVQVIKTSVHAFEPRKEAHIAPVVLLRIPYDETERRKSAYLSVDTGV